MGLGKENKGIKMRQNSVLVGAKLIFLGEGGNNMFHLHNISLRSYCIGHEKI